MKYRVLREGISQRDENGELLERKVDELIEVAPDAASHLVEAGFLESVAEEE